MGITILPSIAQQIGPDAIDAFGKGLEKALRPNRDFQVAMQKAIGGNPALGQQLADLEYNAPGTLNRLGFGDLGTIISKIPESKDSQFARDNRGEILDLQKQKLAQASSETGFDISRLNETINFLKDPKNAAVSADEILHRLTGQTSAQREHTKAETRSANVDASVKEAEADGKIASAGIARKAYEDAIAQFPALQKTDFMSLARDFISKKPGSSQLVAAAYATPGAAEAMNRAMAVVHEETADAFREHLASLRGDKSDENKLTQQAFARYQATKGAGTLNAWKTILSDPDRVQSIKDKNPKDLNQEEKDILHADAAQTQLQQHERVIEQAKANSTIASSLTAIEVHVGARERNGEAPDMGYVNAQLSNLNTTFQTEGKDITAKYGPRPAVGESEPKSGFLGLGNKYGQGVYYVDAAGKRVDDATIFKQQSAGKSARALDFFSRYQAASPTEKKAARDKLMKDEPDVYNELKDVLKP